MLEKLKELEQMSLSELREWKEAWLAYDISLNSNEITIHEIEAIEKTIEDYYEDDHFISFISEDVIDRFEEYRELEVVYE